MEEARERRKKILEAPAIVGDNPDDYVNLGIFHSRVGYNPTHSIYNPITNSTPKSYVQRITDVRWDIPRGETPQLPYAFRIDRDLCALEVKELLQQEYGMCVLGFLRLNHQPEGFIRFLC